MKGFTEESIRKAQKELPDEFGVTTENIMFNLEADRLYCLLNALNKEAMEKHHEKCQMRMYYRDKNSCLKSWKHTIYNSVILRSTDNPANSAICTPTKYGNNPTEYSCCIAK